MSEILLRSSKKDLRYWSVIIKEKDTAFHLTTKVFKVSGIYDQGIMTSASSPLRFFMQSRGARIVLDFRKVLPMLLL